MLNNLEQLEQLLQNSITTPQEKVQRFFKTKPGDYAHHDKFLGITNPVLRIIAKQYKHLSLTDIQTLLQSPYNEKRLLALFILVHQYQKANGTEQKDLYDFFMQNMNHINNWNLVDSSAHLIVGAHLFTQDKKILQELAQSENMWHRRIAIVATWYFIRKNDTAWTFILAQQLLNDKHDLIHKAVGWMLRESGKRNLVALIDFLNLHVTFMPRTMLRYAIEKLPQKHLYLSM